MPSPKLSPVPGTISSSCPCLQFSKLFFTTLARTRFWENAFYHAQFHHRRWRSLLQCCLGGTTTQHRRSFDHRFYCVYNGRNDSRVRGKFSSKIKLKLRMPSSTWDDADIRRYVSTECGRTLGQRADWIPFQLSTNESDSCLARLTMFLEESKSQDVIVINTKNRNSFYNENCHIKFTPNLRKVTGSVL
jgi:hypothetical protein